MQFTFKRDEEGRERIYIGHGGHIYVAEVKVSNDGERWAQQAVEVLGVTYNTLNMAIDRADEAGFWAMRDARSFVDIVDLLETGADAWLNDEITVDVPVADNAVLSVTVGGEES